MIVFILHYHSVFSINMTFLIEIFLVNFENMIMKSKDCKLLNIKRKSVESNFSAKILVEI